MRLPRISISFSGGDKSQDDRLTLPVPWRRDSLHRAQGLDPHDVATRIAAISAAPGDTNLSSDEIAAARRHVASIRTAWGDFQSNLEDDRMVLQVARRVQLLEILEELHHRQTATLTRLDPHVLAREVAEMQA